MVHLTFINYIFLTHTSLELYNSKIQYMVYKQTCTSEQTIFNNVDI